MKSVSINIMFFSGAFLWDESSKELMLHQRNLETLDQSRFFQGSFDPTDLNLMILAHIPKKSSSFSDVKEVSQLRNVIMLYM